MAYSGLRPNVSSRIVASEEVLDEGGLACRVLAEKQNDWLGLQFPIRQRG